MIKVSVIVPNYNHNDTLPRAVRSVSCQTYSNYELIIVDDGSTDGSRETIKNLKDRYSIPIKTEFHDENRGGNAARNTGVQLSSGDYLAFLDADDQWKPTKLQRQVERVESADTGYVGCYCGIHRKLSLNPLDSQWLLDLILGPARTNRWQEGGREVIPKMLTFEWDFGGMSTLLVPKDIFVPIGGFDSVFPRHQDWDFIIRLVKTGPICCVPEKLVIKYGSTPPDSHDEESAKQLLFQKFNACVQKMEDRGFDITRAQCFDLAKTYFLEGDLRKGLFWYGRSKLPHPRQLPVLFNVVRIGLLKSLSRQFL